MNTTIHRCVLLSALLLLLAVPACNSDPRAALYGKWQQESLSDEGLPTYWEFSSDGSLLLSSGDKSQVLKYSFLDDDTIQIDQDVLFPLGGFGGVAIDWKVEEDTLWLTIDDISPLPFTRAK